MSHFKIGFHTGPGGNRTGIGDYFRALDSAGIPACVKSVDDYGPCFELAELAEKSGVPHSITFRLSTAGQKDGVDYDVPSYSLSPGAAAAVHWTKTLKKLPPEFNKKLVWLELINEVDKGLSDWLGRFAAEISRKAISEGYKVALFGWSSGEPEKPDWKTPGMQTFLKLAANNRNQIAVSLHEYSYEKLYLLEDPPYNMVGRFQQLFEACDETGLQRPTVLISEFGWTHRNIPSPTLAMSHLEQATELYAPYPEIESIAIWYLGGNFGEIHNQTQKLIKPVTEMALNYNPGDLEIPVLPADTLEKSLWSGSLDKQIMSYMPEAALQKVIFRHGFVPVSNEYRQGFNGTSYAVQVAEHLGYNERRVYYAEIGDWENIKFLKGLEEPSPDPEPEPPPDPEPEPPTGGAIDLLPYFVPKLDGNGPLYELRDPDGAQRRVQTQADLDWRKFYITKGTGGVDGKSEWEELAWDSYYIWRGIDTSPGDGRFYIQKESGERMARWCKRFMRIGETFQGLGHFVQFYLKESCIESEQNSGPAENQTTLFGKFHSMIFNTLEIKDVIELGRGDGERFWFAKGIGMVGWTSGWNSSFISEIHAPGSRPDNIKEPLCGF